MKTTKLLALLLAATFLLSNCGGKNENEEKEEPKTAADAIENIANQAEKMANDGPKEVIDAKLLKELLPADADGLPRKEVSSEKTGAMGFQVATANARYGEGDSSIEVSIVDVAGTGAIMGMAAWAMVDVDKENDSGYEKTTTYKDHKAFEKYNNDNKDGELAVLLANRFVVSVKGSNVSMAKIKATIDDIDLDKLDDMK
ncbi:transposase [Emticicia sp. C21]|uniref:transposase n=1 Tax=Emticicia sp. C21 TaxID=2302915 RepID=UPI000E356DAE|nr:transposase [Emticicia sp. C21]RFS15133.1 transposase [Emticicia sp. C21]